MSTIPDKNKVRESIAEIIGILKLLSLRGDTSAEAQRLIAEANSLAKSLLQTSDSKEADLIEKSLDAVLTGNDPVKKKKGNSANKHHLFVINPKSFLSNNELKNFLLSVEKCFSVGHRAEYKIFISRYPRDASATVHRYVESVPPHETVRVYAVGGDGIAFDCINGMAKFKNAEIAIIPYGNANDICRSFGEEHFHDFRNIKLMSRSGTRPMDVIECGKLRAVASCSIGIESMAAKRFEEIIEKLNGSKWRKFIPVIYNLGGISCSLEGMARGPEYKITMDGVEISGRFTAINIGNIALNGGKNMPNPLALPDDGWLDVVISKSLSVLETLHAFPYFTSGRYYKLPSYFKHYRCREFICESDEQMNVILDGENFYINKLTLKLAHNQINIVTPNGIEFADYSGGLTYEK